MTLYQVQFPEDENGLSPNIQCELLEDLNKFQKGEMEFEEISLEEMQAHVTSGNEKDISNQAI